MPGELNFEDDKQEAGYRENQYKTRGENGDQGPIDPDSQSSLPNSKMIMNVLKLVRCQDKDSLQE